MAAWVVWLVLAMLLGAAEAFTLTVVLGLLAGAALVTSGVAAVGLPPAVQLLVFAAVSAAGVLLVRPIARRHMMRPQFAQFGTEALVGRPAYAITRVTGRDGTVRIGGEEWTARSYAEDMMIPAGAAVHVMQIDGVTAIVYPQE